jgi:hypothetical protein
MSVAEIYGNIAQEIAKLDPLAVIQLHPSPEMDDRVEELVIKKKVGEISMEENTELERYLALDLLINLAKANAKKLLQ